MLGLSLESQVLGLGLMIKIVCVLASQLPVPNNTLQSFRLPKLATPFAPNTLGSV